MTHIVTINYTKSLLRKAVFAYWRRSIGIGFFVALALLLGFLVILVQGGDRSWFVGVCGTVFVFVFGIGFAFALYFIHLHNTLEKFRKMGEPNATLSLDDASFNMSSSLGNASLQWSSVKEIWRFQSFWLLLLSKAQFVTIPLASVSSGAQAFILSRVSAAGGKVVGSLETPHK